MHIKLYITGKRESAKNDGDGGMGQRDRARGGIMQIGKGGEKGGTGE